MRVFNDYKCNKCDTVEQHFIDPSESVFCKCGEQKVKLFPKPRMNGNCAHGMVHDTKNLL